MIQLIAREQINRHDMTILKIQDGLQTTALWFIFSNQGKKVIKRKILILIIIERKNFHSLSFTL